MGHAAKKSLWAAFVVTTMTSCSPDRPLCDTSDASCLMSKYAYDVDRMPPRFSQAYELVSVVSFDEAADEIAKGNVELDTVAMAHLLHAYFENNGGRVCGIQRFREFVIREKGRIQSVGPRDARLLIERIACNEQ